MNRWNIPDWLEAYVLERDKDCIYCRATFDPLSPKVRPSGSTSLTTRRW